MKEAFNDWCETQFSLLLNSFKHSEQLTGLIRALYPGFELASIKHYDGNKLSLSQKLKWYYFLLFKKDEDYILNFPDSEIHDVILWPSQGKHFTLQLPVYYQIKKLNIRVAFISSTSSVQDAIKKEGVTHIEVKTIKKRSNRASVFFQNMKVLKTAKTFAPFIYKNKKIYFHNILTEALSLRAPFDKSSAIYASLIKSNKPKMIFFGYGFSTIAFTLDKKCLEDRIITATLQVGRLTYYLVKRTLLKVHYSYGPDVSKNIYKLVKTIESVEVGSVKIELTETAPGKTEVETLVKGIREKFEKIGLIAFSGPGLSVSAQGHIENLKILKEAISKHPEVYFIIKFHGKDFLHFYSDYQNLNNVLIVHQEHEIFKYDIMHLIKQCDLLISGASTTLMEASYWYKPAISIDVLGELKTIELAGEDFIYQCTDQNSLDKALESILKVDETNKNKMALMKLFSDRSFTKGAIPPSELVAMDVLKRINPNSI